jgi:hypothetical protein
MKIEINYYTQMGEIDSYPETSIWSQIAKC